MQTRFVYHDAQQALTSCTPSLAVVHFTPGNDSEPWHPPSPLIPRGRKYRHLGKITRITRIDHSGGQGRFPDHSLTVDLQRSSHGKQNLTAIAGWARRRDHRNTEHWALCTKDASSSPPPSGLMPPIFRPPLPSNSCSVDINTAILGKSPTSASTMGEVTFPLA